ncbi:hypothetical protein Tco_0369887, partial [Tanacetum coccineum]
MLAPKCATYNGRSTFANPKYLKRAQSDKPCLYEIPYDTLILQTILPQWEEPLTLERGKLFNSCTGKVESEPTHGSNVDIPHIHACKQTLGLSGASLKAPFLNVQMTSVHISSGLVLHQMTSDHNRSELGIQDHSNEQSSSKLVPKVVPLAVKTTTSRQELGLLFHLHIAMLRTT